MADKCYMLGRPHAPMTWMEISRECQRIGGQLASRTGEQLASRIGGQLASVRTPEHKQHLQELFKYLGWPIVKVFIGLQAASPDLPNM